MAAFGPIRRVFDPNEIAMAAAKKKSSSKTPARELHVHPDAGISKKLAKQLYNRLIEERDRVLEGMGQHISEAIGDAQPLSEEMDQAQRHSEQAYLMRFADKERKLLREIDHAISKFDDGEYGVCEGTGEPIATKRLELRPWTRYSVEYKEQLERERRQHR